MLSVSGIHRRPIDFSPMPGILVLLLAELVKRFRSILVVLFFPSSNRICDAVDAILFFIVVGLHMEFNHSVNGFFEHRCLGLPPFHPLILIRPYLRSRPQAVVLIFEWVRLCAVDGRTGTIHQSNFSSSQSGPWSLCGEEAFRDADELARPIVAFATGLHPASRAIPDAERRVFSTSSGMSVHYCQH